MISRSHADNDSMIKTAQEQSALSGGVKFLYRNRIYPQYRAFRKTGTDTGDIDLLNISQRQSVVIYQFADSSEGRGYGVGRLDHCLGDDGIILHTDYLGSTASDIKSYNHLCQSLFCDPYDLCTVFCVVDICDLFRAYAE